ncbi:hypothetical protein BV25DRAFT_1709818 [Artomyces pyxidatus]|uniref:Uncharacterized protein n=1 Tax=Artomyces pyxidatus TaxID=48021 RepID=A0ACB8TB83_9AGAM|nr:hypothetical protein BV25DRAFT_1709818 [Artomyces pyxidatus]
MMTPSVFPSSSIASPAPVYHIPIEILSKIFCFLPGGASESRRFDRLPSCIAITHVCRHWRSVAYVCRTLWTTPLLENKTWTEIALEHSRPGLLTVVCTVSRGRPPPAEGALRSVLVDLSRIKYLAIAHDALLSDAVRNMLTMQPASHLETLLIDTLQSIYSIPDAIFRGIIPSAMRVLKLRGCDVGVASPLLHAGLKTLDIDPCPLQINAMLARCAPELEVLRLHVDLEGDGWPPVELPKLQSLDLSGALEHVTQMLPEFSFPRACRAVSLSYLLQANPSASSTIIASLEACFVDAVSTGAHYESLSISEAEEFQSAHGTVLRWEEPQFGAGTPSLPDALVIAASWYWAGPGLANTRSSKTSIGGAA